MTRRKVKIERTDISEVRPKKIKKFNMKRFLKLAEAVKKAVEKEEKKYGDSSRLAV